ncbi:lytic transglycosylase domain-containing protein [Methylorubrum extorquens]|uniref:lytic transglycosylase domain-containing protein n=1 Tax=Methylorubrum extorquens TaxID=408 RepID=UPI00209F29EA|nr:lytic transglycosylase domain-containing protein [Methylorubrum extorquens]MCP1540129.1 soluble lytic murein transglycosylase-like protein [Methylorubrum extorquens]
MRHLTFAALVALATVTAASDAAARGRHHQTGHVPAIVSHEAAKAGVPQRIAHAVIKTESGYNCRARNRSGAAGAGQLMPATARSLGVRNVFDCRQNIAASMRYLRAAINRGGAGCAGVSLYETGVGARPRCSAYGRRVMRSASL